MSLPIPTPDAFGMLLVGLVAFFVFAILWKTRTAGYTDAQKRQRKALKRGLRRSRGDAYSTLEDADGGVIHLATVNGVHIAHRDKESLFNDFRHVVDTGKPTLSEYYRKDLREGLVDIDDTVPRLAADCKLRIEANLRESMERDESGIDASEMRRKHVDEFRYPDYVYDESLSQLESEGVIQQVGNELVYLYP